MVILLEVPIYQNAYILNAHCYLLCKWEIVWKKVVAHLRGSWKGRKKIRVGIFVIKNLLGQGYRKQTTFGGTDDHAETNLFDLITLQQISFLIFL